MSFSLLLDQSWGKSSYSLGPPPQRSFLPLLVKLNQFLFGTNLFLHIPVYPLPFQTNTSDNEDEVGCGGAGLEKDPVDLCGGKWRKREAGG